MNRLLTCCFRLPTHAPKFNDAFVTTTKQSARVVKVYDGDSITIVLPFRYKYFEFKTRLVGIDTPELRTRNEKEKEMGYQAKEFLKQLVDQKIIQVECQGMDKYGRLLIVPYIHGKNVCDLMVEKGWAKRYDGGTKEKWNFDV